jgi:hypothetical protein
MPTVGPARQAGPARCEANGGFLIAAGFLHAAVDVVRGDAKLI